MFTTTDKADAYFLGNQLGLKSSHVNEAISLFVEVRRSQGYFNQRTDKCLLVDCIYLIGRHRKPPITYKDIQRATKAVWGERTKPNPNKWTPSVQSLIDDALQ